MSDFPNINTLSEKTWTSENENLINSKLLDSDISIILELVSWEEQIQIQNLLDQSEISNISPNTILFFVS